MPLQLQAAIIDDFSGHGGGDNRMVEELLDMIMDEKAPNNRTTSVEKSIESHYVALAAAQSRLVGGAVILLDSLRKVN